MYVLICHIILNIILNIILLSGILSPTVYTMPMVRAPIHQISGAG